MYDGSVAVTGMNVDHTRGCRQFRCVKYHLLLAGNLASLGVMVP